MILCRNYEKLLKITFHHQKSHFSPTSMHNWPLNHSTSQNLLKKFPTSTINLHPPSSTSSRHYIHIFNAIYSTWIITSLWYIRMVMAHLHIISVLTPKRHTHTHIFLLFLLHILHITCCCLLLFLFLCVVVMSNGDERTCYMHKRRNFCAHFYDNVIKFE